MHKRRKKLFFSAFVVFICLTLLVNTASLIAQVKEIPDTEAGKRAKEIIYMINQDNRQKWQEYITENLTQDFIDRVSIETLLAIYSETCDIYGRLEFGEYVYKEKNPEYNIKMKLFSKETSSWVNLSVSIEESSPHKIKSISAILTIAPRDLRPKTLSDEEIVDSLSLFMDTLVKNNKFSGTVLLAKNGKILFKGAYGLSSLRYNVPNKLDTKFNIGSMNKMFTSVAVAQLVEEGKLSYDDPVGKYLDSSWVQLETAEKVKIKHLLTHTSGLGDFFNDKFKESSRLLHRGIDDWKPLINNDKPKFEPGTEHSYSNSGMFLLGAIIEKISGQSYYDYIGEHIYAPASMVNSGCFDNDQPILNLAIGYEKNYTDEGFYWRNNIFNHTVKGGPAGGGFSTVEDLFHFALALKEGKLISKKSFELLTSAKPELNSPRYGYGFGVQKDRNDIVVGHTGGFMGISAILQIFKKSGYVYTIISNHSNGIDLVWVKLFSMLPTPQFN